MANIEKVIENVETAFDIWIDEYEGTSYFNIAEVKQAKKDALELLNRQETELCDRCGRVRLKSKWKAGEVNGQGKGYS